MATYGFLNILQEELDKNFPFDYEISWDKRNHAVEVSFLLEAQNTAGVEMLDEDGEVSSDDIPCPNMWELPGGGREGDESPFECATREVYEELGIHLNEDCLLWSKIYPSMLYEGRQSVFMVGQFRISLTVSPLGMKGRLIN